MCAEFDIKMTWYEYNRTLFIYTPNRIEYKLGFACFDLDWTLIRPNKGKFATDINDMVIMSNRINVLKNLNETGYNIVIFTNQKLTVRESIEFKLNRMNNFISILRDNNIDVMLFIATNEDEYRKPNTAMWEHLNNIFGGEINKEYSFYCGDAAGRVQDFSDSDINFSKNIGIQFYYPEDLFGES